MQKAFRIMESTFAAPPHDFPHGRIHFALRERNRNLLIWNK